ncbi:hypothetical protein CaCOL14_005960 [Colletotrichum acutatum]
MDREPSTQAAQHSSLERRSKLEYASCHLTLSGTL